MTHTNHVSLFELLIETFGSTNNDKRLGQKPYKCCDSIDTL